MENTFEIKLVNPGIWQAVLEDSLTGLSPRAKATAQSVLRTLHNRHIGITPQLAAELAPLLVEAYTPRHGHSPWVDVLKRLQQETSDPRYSFGIMLSTVPLYSVLRLAGPILEEACRRIGQSLLFCQDHVETGVTREDYDRYAQALDNEIKTMTQLKDDVFRMFWLDRAMTLAAYSRQGGISDLSTNTVPETDPTALGLLTRLNPELSKTQPLSSYTRRLSDPLQHREESRLREGGFSGIHISRRPEDMGDILLSEFVNPSAVFADRLINTGFLALRRQTRREQLRDVLIAGLMPAQVEPKLSRDFIKACWFDFLGRFGAMLAQSGRKRSEFRWLEGNTLGQVRQCCILLQDLPAWETPTIGMRETSFPREFIMAAGMLPQYLDSRYRYEFVTRDGEQPKGLDNSAAPVMNRELDAARNWAFSIWRSQQENRRWLNHEQEKTEQTGTGFSGEKPLNPDEYAVIHLMLFLPARYRGQGNKTSAASGLGTMTGGFGLGNVPGRNLSVTWVPEHITATREWAFDCRGKGDTLIFSREKTDRKLNCQHIAGRLEETWRNQLMKEIKEL